MMPGCHSAHSGIRQIEYLEDPDHDAWEIDRVNNCLSFNGVTSMTIAYGVVLVYETLEQVLVCV
jgi:hypothetical protein